MFTAVLVFREMQLSLVVMAVKLMMIFFIYMEIFLLSSFVKLGYYKYFCSTEEVFCVTQCAEK